jgi:predicted metal-dependent phosphotriesterase family hydrolase
MPGSEDKGSVQGVAGPIAARDLGITQCHEHVSIDIFRVNQDEMCVLTDPNMTATELDFASTAGLKTIVDVGTDSHLRDPNFLLQAAQNSTVNVVAATGYWREQVYPDYVHTSSVEEIASVLAKDLTQGILGTDIRAGVIGEIASEASGFTDLTDKIFRACASAQIQTGVALITHTPEGIDAIKQLDLLTSCGVDPGRILIGHVDCMDDVDMHSRIAAAGAYVGYDRIGIDRYQPDELRVRLIVDMIERGYVGALILSLDLATQRRMHAQGGLGYAYLLEAFIPRLLSAGVTQQDIDTMLIENPARLLTGHSVTAESTSQNGSQR